METTTGELGCPQCGSPKYIADTKGFSAGKAVAGVILTGGIGLLAGLHGNKDIVLTCAACGHKYKPGEGKPILTQEFLNDIDRQAKELLQAGKDNDALTLLREKKGIGLIDASVQMGKMKEQLGIAKKGCAGIMLLLITMSGITSAIIIHALS